MGKLEKIEKCVQKGKEDELVKLVHDRDKNVRLAAIAGLGRAGKDNACNVLITLLLDDDQSSSRFGFPYTRFLCRRGCRRHVVRSLSGRLPP